MKETVRIDNQLLRAMNGDAWHGPALFELLQGITAEQAQQYSIEGVHNVWELVLHITTWQKVTIKRLSGENYEPNDKDNWPDSIDYSTQNWEHAMEELYRTYQSLREKILHFPESELDSPVTGQHYTFYVLLHGLIQHNLYHAGQIALLRKKLK